ncbi:hypothetical protein JHK82_025169 [Glycine max]|nr:hypothetical protein JHK82_025169 [Glycine max]
MGDLMSFPTLNPSLHNQPIRVCRILGLDESYLPRWIGYGFGSLLLLNHFLGSDSATVTPAQLSTKVLGLSLASFSIVLPYLGKFLKGAQPMDEKTIPDDTEQIFFMSTDIVDCLKEDLAWASYVLLRNTNVIAMVFMVKLREEIRKLKTVVECEGEVDLQALR